MQNLAYSKCKLSCTETNDASEVVYVPNPSLISLPPQLIVVNANIIQKFGISEESL